MTHQIIPTKPDSDSRLYRVVELPNKLSVIICSDPETQSSAAAIAVSAGQLQDSPEVQGLAHFLEHMLFLGNKKYPGESDFDSFCASSAGYSNAWTSMDRTVYHYVLAHDKLRDSLDRFSGFFSCPLFSEDLTDRELNAIESENNKNLQDDSRREFQLLRSTAKGGHPLQRFGTGNIYSLKEVPEKAGTNTRAHLLDFYKRAYSANTMTLAVLGREDLDTLESWVREFFADIPNSDLEPLAGVEAGDDPFDDGWKRIFRIVPVKERRKLIIYFPCADTYSTRMYRQKPHRLISHCLGHEGPGSLLSLLKAKGWATELGAGTATQSTHFSIFEISIKLTEEGLPNYLEIISLIFQYLVIRFRGSDHSERQRIRSEMTHIEELNFRFKQKVREDQYTEQLACNLSRYPPVDCISGPDLFFDELDMSVVDDIVDKYFQPENMRVHLIAPEEEQPDLPSGAHWEEEFWYKSKYLGIPIQEKQAQSWADKSQKCHENLHLPTPNPYTPESSLMKDAPSDVDVKTSPPSLVVDTPTLKLWHLIDTSFKQPKASCHVQLTNFMVEESPRMAICLRMLLEILHEITNEEAYEAEESGLIFDVTNTSQTSQCCGLRLTFKGYNDKLPILVKNIMTKLATFDVKEHASAFDLTKEATIMDYRNRRFQQNYVHALIAINELLEHPHWNTDERLAEMETITMDEVQQFVKRFFSEILVETVIVGNISKEEAVDMMTSATKMFSWSPLSSGNIPRLDMTQLTPGVTVLRELLTPDPGAVDSAVVTYFQMGPRDAKKDSLLELLCQAVLGLGENLTSILQIMDKEMYAQLRTVEQLGYVDDDIFPVAESVHHPSFLEIRIETFLENFSKHLEEMNQEHFAEHVDSLMTKKKEQDRSVERRCCRFMTEVCSHNYVFNRAAKIVEQLETVTKADLVEFFKTYVSAASSCRAKLTCHVVGKQALDIQVESGEEPDVTAESASKVLIFPKGSVPFPIDAGEPTELPEPNVVDVKSFRESTARYSEQK